MPDRMLNISQAGRNTQGCDHRRPSAVGVFLPGFMAGFRSNGVGMSSEQLEQVKSTLAIALQKSIEERRQLLDACQDLVVRDEVAILLELHQMAGDFLNTPAPELFGVRSKQSLDEGALLSGRYRIREERAKSGFATV